MLWQSPTQRDDKPFTGVEYNFAVSGILNYSVSKFIPATAYLHDKPVTNKLKVYFNFFFVKQVCLLSNMSQVWIKPEVFWYFKSTCSKTVVWTTTEPLFYNQQQQQQLLQSILL